MKQITGADLFVKALKEEAVDTLFAYPGGQAIDLFNALYGEREIDVILPRHEQGLIHAADGYARILFLLIGNDFCRFLLHCHPTAPNFTDRFLLPASAHFL